MAVEIIDARLAEEPEAEKVDLWSERRVVVSEGAEVIIGVWDTGVDPAVQGARMWENPNPTQGYSPHGVTFDAAFEPEAADLLPEASNYADDMDEMMNLLKGSLDLRAGINSDEAQLLRETMANMQPGDVQDFQKRMMVLSNYIHGQHVADIAARDLASAKLMNIRMTWPTDPVPTEPIDEAFANGLVGAAKEAVSFMKTHDVRVVNMSWRMTRPAVESMLQVTGAEKDPEARKERAAKIFEIMRSGLEEAFQSAPEILFVAGAGNEDENVEFVQSVPAGINLPNLITAGAVDSALEPAGFTSYGSSIDVYANGFEVPGRVPGGQEINLSGTSMAAPQVANLAAKLFATNPDFSVDEVRAIIENTATEEGEQALKVVHPVKAVEAAQAS
jgi:hypothetical protein